MLHFTTWSFWDPAQDDITMMELLLLSTTLNMLFYEQDMMLSLTQGYLSRNHPDDICKTAA